MAEKPTSRQKVTVSRSIQSRFILFGTIVLFLYSVFLIGIAYLPQIREYFQAGLSAERHDALQNQLMGVIFLVFFSLIASVLLVLMFTNRFFVPFNIIKEKLLKLLDRNLTVRMASENVDELGELAGEFNTFVDEFERLVLVLRLEQEEISMILMKAKKETHTQSTRDILNRISRHNEKIIEYLLNYRVIGDR